MKASSRGALVVLWVSLFLLVSSALLLAQSSNTATVVGSVTDSTGAVIQQATLTLRDITTEAVRTVTTNSAGRYSFVSVPPGSYDVKASAPGFAASVSRITVEVGKSYAVDLALKVGAEQETVEVVGATGAELQTMDATVGTSIGGDTLLMLPTPQRNVSSLLLLQPGAIPAQQASESSRFGGQVAGSQSDQGTILLDGGNATSGVSGNSDYYNAFHGGPEAPIATPQESIQEFKVSTNNPNASFSGATGSLVQLVTKRGTNAYHGSAYWFFQNDALDANSWNRNFQQQARPQSKDNRYGGSFGGYIPKLPEKAKTYFYANYEGRRHNDLNNQISKLVPSDSLRNGILQFRDATGNVIAYDLKTSAQCGTSGTSMCDPLGLGISPAIAAIWSKMPSGNDPSNSAKGDGLNTVSFSAPIKLPVSDDFGVIRLDHSFGKNWQAMGSYRYYTQSASTVRQVDIGGFLPGDTAGVPASASPIPRQPRYVVLGLTGQISSNWTNQLNFNYMRDWWKWLTSGAVPQVSGLGGALVIGAGGQNTSLQPVNLDTGNTRQRTWLGHDYGWRDDVSWLRGNHLVQFGGAFTRHAVRFDRNDGQVSALNQYLYNISASSGVNISSSYRPRTCTTTVTANCLPSNQNSQWNTMYASVLGLVDQATILATRNAQLQANPLGTPAFNDVRYNDYSLYINDAWHVRPTLTLNFGLNWSASMPPQEVTGKLTLMVDSSTGNVINPFDYLQKRKAAALQGQVYNPVIGFEPLKDAKRAYPWQPYYGDFAPRVSAAWNPHFEGGLLGRVFGNGKTVIRGGYGILYDRLIGEQKAINTVQSYGFQQTLICTGPSISGACLGSSGTNPQTAFRIGVNGNSVAVPQPAAISSLPMIPGTSAIAQANQPITASSFQMDPEYRPARNHEIDLTVQRELTKSTILEVGYINHIANGIYSPIQLNQVPYFMTVGGQSFAAAYDAVAAALRVNSSPASVPQQPFFEAALAGNSICNAVSGAPNNCTAGVVSKFSSRFLTSQVQTLWTGLQSSFVFGPATASTYQDQSMFFWAGRGRSDYNAGFITFHERAWKGLTLDANFTYSHSLDNVNLSQDNDSSAPNAFDLNYGYGTSGFDRKFVFNLFGNWQLPFGKGTGLWGKLARGWSLSPLWSWYTALPLKVTAASGQAYGGGSSSALAVGAIPIGPLNFGNTLHSGVAGDATSGVGISGNPATGGTGFNLFADPTAVFNSFRQPLISQDTSSYAGGQLRGLNRWNMDLNVARKFNFTERVSATVSAQMFNLFNHVLFADPSVSLSSPQTFGVIDTQINQPRAITLGLHLDW